VKNTLECLGVKLKQTLLALSFTWHGRLYGPTQLPAILVSIPESKILASPGFLEVSLCP
jgi:hypothetical protein